MLRLTYQSVTILRSKIQGQVRFLNVVDLLSRIFHKGIIGQNANLYAVRILQRQVIHIHGNAFDAFDLHHIMHNRAPA